jgi:SAM-dependent methyltransferase
MTEQIDIGEFVRAATGEYAGIRFPSLPAGIRQLQMANAIFHDFAQNRSGVVGLDIGSKYGDLSHLLQSRGITLYRLDIEKREDTYRFFLGNGHAMGIRSHSLDFAVLSHVLAHIPDLDLLFQELARVLKPGGKLFILQNNVFGWWKFWGYYILQNDKKVHLRRFDLWQIRNLLHSHGFAIDKIDSPFYFYIHSKYSRRLLHWDLRHSHRMPRVFATQWLITARNEKPGVAIKPPPVLRRAVLFIPAAAHAVLLKSLELFLRAVKRGANTFPKSD